MAVYTFIEVSECETTEYWLIIGCSEYSGAHLNIETSSYQYRNSHNKYKMVSRLSHLYNRSTLTWKDCLYIEMGSWPLHGMISSLNYKFFYDFWMQTWWHHQMETFSALLDLCAGNSLVIGEFLAQRPVTQSFDVFFDMRLNERLSKQSWGWWFETPSCPLWCHNNGDSPGGQNPPSWKTRPDLSCTVSTMAAHDLVMNGARAWTTMALTQFFVKHSGFSTNR